MRIVSRKELTGLLDEFGGDGTTLGDECERFERGEDVPLLFGESYGREGLFAGQGEQS